MRIAVAVAEDDVQPPGDLVDEVVHVALEAAVVVAGEDHPALVVEEDPAREVDRLHAGQVAVVEDVPRHVVDREEHAGQRQAPEEAGLDEAERRERVLDDVVLERRRAPGRPRPAASRAGRCLASRAGGAAMSEERRGEEQERQEQRARAAPRRRGARARAAGSRGRAPPPAGARRLSTRSASTCSATRARTAAGRCPAGCSAPSRNSSSESRSSASFADLATRAADGVHVERLLPDRWRSQIVEPPSRVRCLPRDSPRSARRAGRCPRRTARRAREMALAGTSKSLM